MGKLRIDELIEILSRDVLKNNSCVEMNFFVDGDTEYTDCWLGKMPNKEKLGLELYWYGLVPDGTQAYDFYDLHEFLNAKVFHNESLIDIFDKISMNFIMK